MKSSQTARGHARNLRRAWHAANFGRAKPAYLGWTGLGNLGDQAILEAQRSYFGKQFQVLPPVDMRTIMQISRRMGSRRVCDTLLLGGGTVVGRQEWLDRLRTHESLAGAQRLFVWGAGVEDPSFRGENLEALASWSALLQRAGSVGVRGPMSAELLASVGVDAQVVGDPALRLVCDAPVPRVEGRILVNVAHPEAVYSDAKVDVVAEVAGALRTLIASGYSVVVFAMHADDHAPARALAEAVPGARIIGTPSSVQALLTEVSAADIVISERLHGNVLAAAVGRPFISLDYRPKCLDFALSVGMGEFNISLRALHASQIVERVAALSANDQRRVADCVLAFRSMSPPVL